MEILTNGIDFCKMHCEFGSNNECFYDDKAKCYENNIYEKLRKYEELEEQGLLLRLPCKVGDQFWEIDQTWLNPFIYPRKAHSLQHVVYCMERLGKTTFLTKEEAKAALEKIKGEEHE